MKLLLALCSHFPQVMAMKGKTLNKIDSELNFSDFTFFFLSVYNVKL